MTHAHAKPFFTPTLTYSVLVGIDEAGRGPVIGPLVVCAVAVSDNDLTRLEALHLRDSKKYTRHKREELEKTILSVAECEITEITAYEIDNQRQKRSLNDIEAELFARALSTFPDVTQVIVDACDVNAARFGEKVCSYSGVTSIISQHKADINYPIVSAASILAKVRRDRRIDELKEIYGDFGSGYCSDKRTCTFLREYLKKERRLPPIARSSWDTAQRLVEEYHQCSLNNFL